MFNTYSKKTRFDTFLEYYYQNKKNTKIKPLNFSQRDKLEFSNFLYGKCSSNKIIIIFIYFFLV